MFTSPLRRTTRQTAMAGPGPSRRRVCLWGIGAKRKVDVPMGGVTAYRHTSREVLGGSWPQAGTADSVAPSPGLRRRIAAVTRVTMSPTGKTSMKVMAEL